MNLYPDISKKERTCRGCRGKIPAKTTCFVQKVPSIQTAKGYTMYSDQSFCVLCALKISSDIAAGNIQLAESLKRDLV